MQLTQSSQKVVLEYVIFLMSTAANAAFLESITYLFSSFNQTSYSPEMSA